MFTGNVLIVGRTGCGKTYFMQKLAVNTFFGKLKRVEWVSYSDLDEKRETEFCFSCDADFHYSKSIEQLEDLLEVFKACLRTAKRTTIPLRLMMNFLMIVMVLEKKQPATDLLLWTTFLTYLANQKNLQVFRPSLVNLITHASKFSTLSIQRNQFGQRVFLKLIFLIFLLLVFL